MDIGTQIRKLRGGIDVAVGTPGRFIDLINRGNLDLGMVSACCPWAEHMQLHAVHPSASTVE